MTWQPYPYGCPTCGAHAFRPCRTLKTGRVTDTHVARIDGTRPAATKDEDGE